MGYPPSQLNPRSILVAAVVVGILSFAGLAANLNQPFLWQDEAATAVLAERLFQYGRPLGYDGRNLISRDFEAELASHPARAVSADAGLSYLIARGDFKTDTTWTFQPWGQFVLAGLALETLGHGTWQARIPFALCGALTVSLLFAFVARRFGWLAALLSIGLLLANVYWVLHVRQCRYYAASSLFTLSTFVAYWRWQEGARGAFAPFIAIAWLFFQFDYGSFFPVVGTLALDSICLPRRSRVAAVAVFALIFVTIAPWIVYYDLTDRRVPGASLDGRLFGTLYNVNHFVLPIPLLAAVPLVIWLTRRRHEPARTPASHLLGASALVIVVSLIWAVCVTPASFLRYVIGLAPLACLIAVVVISELTTYFGDRWPRGLAFAVKVVAVLVLAATPWIATPVDILIPARYLPFQQCDLAYRREFARLYDHYTGRQPDSIKAVLERLESRLRPDDEVVTNYEDIPLMFYTPNRIRGGISDFRVLDSSSVPRIAIFHPMAEFSTKSIILGQLRSDQWQVVEASVPDTIYANSPEPRSNVRMRPPHLPGIVLVERISAAP